MSAVSVAPPRSAAGIHKAVLGSLRSLLRKAAAVKVAQIAKATHKDPRTVKYHLELLEASGNIIFLDAERSVLGTPATLSKALEGAGWDKVGMANLGEVWDNASDDRWNNV